MPPEGRGFKTFVSTTHGRRMSDRPVQAVSSTHSTRPIIVAVKLFCHGLFFGIAWRCLIVVPLSRREPACANRRLLAHGGHTRRQRNVAGCSAPCHRSGQQIASKTQWEETGGAEHAHETS